MPDQARYRCDFCLDEPVTHTLVADKEVGIESLGILWSKEWAMCARCAELALAGDWLGLRRYLFARQEAKFGLIPEQAKLEMRVAYRDLRRHTVMFYTEDSPPS